MAPYEPPTYTQTVVPGTAATLPCCSLCGAVTLRPRDHDEWHAWLDGVLQGLGIKAERGDRAAAMMTPIGGGRIG